MGINNIEVDEIEVMHQQSLCGFLHTAIDGGIIKINTALLNWLGYTNNSFDYTIKFPALLDNESLEWYKKKCLPILLKKNYSKAKTLSLIKIDTNLLPVILEASMVINKQEGDYFIFTIVRSAPLINLNKEILSLKERETAIQILNEELELKVSQRTIALQKNQAILEEAQAITKIGSWEINLETNEKSWSPEMYRITGYNPSEPAPTLEQQRNNYLPDEWEKVNQLISNAINQGTSYAEDLNFYKQDGSLAIVNARGKAIKNKKGITVRLVGTLNDITETKKVQALVEEQRYIFHTILEQSLAGYWDWMIKEDTAYFSPAYKSMFGYEEHEIPNHPESWKKIIFQEDLPGVLELLQLHIESKGGIPFYNEVRYNHKNGNTIWVICKGKVIDWDGLGNPVRMIGCHIDITKQKQTATYLEKSRQELESFSYSVSHDLRAPLRGIDGWSLALQEDYGKKLDEAAKIYIERVRSEAQRMGHIIDDLLNLSHINRTKVKMDIIPLSALAQKVVARLQESNKNRHIEFIIEKELQAYGDVSLMEILLTNLFENAVKFTAQKNEATIEFGSSNQNGQPIYFVKDNGAGFDINTATNLFGAFQRMHKKSEFEGTGIGLATVRRIINLHNGNVWANATIDKGATFYFTLK